MHFHAMKSLTFTKNGRILIKSTKFYKFRLCGSKMWHCNQVFLYLAFFKYLTSPLCSQGEARQAAEGAPITSTTPEAGRRGQDEIP